MHPSQPAVVFDGILYWAHCRVMVRGDDIAIVARRGLATCALEVSCHVEYGPTAKGFWAHSGLLEYFDDEVCSILLELYGTSGFRAVLGELAQLIERIDHTG